MVGEWEACWPLLSGKVCEGWSRVHSRGTKDGGIILESEENNARLCKTQEVPSPGLQGWCCELCGLNMPACSNRDAKKPGAKITLGAKKRDS